MRINGKDLEAVKPLTVRELRAFLASLAPERDGDLVHFLCMVGSEDEDDETHYVTHVELDCFDMTEEDPDDPKALAIRRVSLMHWPSRDAKP